MKNLIIEKSLYDKVSKTLHIDYEGIRVGSSFVRVSKDDLEYMIKDLLREIGYQKEKYEDLEQDLHDNYKPISIEEQIE